MIDAVSIRRGIAAEGFGLAGVWALTAQTNGVSKTVTATVF
jgi:hypothetical protein